MFPEIVTAFRLLTFRAASDELKSLNRRHLVLGLLLTWLVGIGRWWENPRAGLLQHLGLGSVAYVFVLSFFLWMILWPMAPAGWSLFKVLTFVSLTSLPGILYAIPVRHGLNLETAQEVRLWFLGVVAGWRVGLLAFYLGRGAGFSGARRVVAVLFPLALIVFTLTSMNLDRVVFDFMGGIQSSDRSVNDRAYQVLLFLSLVSVLLIIPLFLSYVVMSVSTLKDKSERRRIGRGGVV